jgi:hypothetical protein
MQAKPRNPRRYIVGYSDKALLQAIMRYQCMTAMQLTKLLYSQTSLTWIQAKLKALHAGGYLQRDRIPSRLVKGSPPLYYALARPGLGFLAQQGVAVAPGVRAYQVHEYSYLFLAHLLAVNEVLIAAELVCKHQPALRLARILHDSELKRRPVYLVDGAGKKRAVIPDGFLDFEVHASAGGYRAPICLEVDRGTERQQDFRRKIRALIAFSRGPYEAVFGRTALTICVIASGNPARMQSLLAWTRAELAELRVSDAEADIFRFGDFALNWNLPEAERPTPAQLFLEPRWYRAEDSKPVALFPGL